MKKVTITFRVIHASRIFVQTHGSPKYIEGTVDDVFSVTTEYGEENGLPKIYSMHLSMKEPVPLPEEQILGIHLNDEILFGKIKQDGETIYA